MELWTPGEGERKKERKKERRGRQRETEGDRGIEGEREHVCLCVYPCV